MPGTVSPETVADQILWLRRDTSTTPLHIVKLVYLCHGWMLGLKGKPLISEPAVVGKYGPIVQSVYDTYKVFGSHPIITKPKDHSSDLDRDQRQAVEFVMAVYVDFEDTELSAITHEEDTPWSRANESEGIGGVIPDESIREHYEEMIRGIKAGADAK